MVARWLEILGSISMLISTAIALVVSLIYLVVISLSQGRNLSVSSLLASNTFLSALTYSSAHFTIAISVLKSDVVAIDGIRNRLYNPFCMSSAFVFYGGCALLYYSYVMEAMQRFSRVVLYDYRWLHRRRVQLLFIIIQWLFCILGTFIPLSITNQLQYDIYMNMCIIPIRSSGWTMYYAIYCYTIPLVLIAFFYHKLIQYITTVRSRVSACLISGSVVVAAQRQLALIQRVIVLVSILIASGLPYSAFIFMGFWMDPPVYQFRISFLCVDISLATVVCTMFRYSRDIKRLRRI
ncbi:unnamed protein product [Rotaria sp. Silwood1]|nr:unnamed protein product [Rotaria sp. Silwood1]CAF1128135.1 unnamed protein product [Rotaria sp. Silwood1]CAF1250864.1 unnamed protein product [Rotaria sp. Silwood1]CAF3439215.1 unnamed protein product [Rotaria sp. Silwood1]CAF3461438.1 unnamed protein product [Rotaria sp. Silwood1]